MGKKRKPRSPAVEPVLDDITGRFTIHNYKGEEVSWFMVSGLTWTETEKFISTALKFLGDQYPITPSRMATLLGVSPSWVRQLIAEGKLAAHRPQPRRHMTIPFDVAYAYLAARGKASPKRK